MISKIFFILIFRLSRDVRRYLRNPDKLFRRVRDKHGNLRLSKAAKAYHPGRGVYRSSYRNALRLTATENNMVIELPTICVGNNSRLWQASKSSYPTTTLAKALSVASWTSAMTLQVSIRKTSSLQVGILIADTTAFRSKQVKMN